MRTFSLVLLSLAAALYIFAQEPTPPQSPQTESVKVPAVAAQTPPTTLTCAIPLLEAQIFKDLRFTMKVIAPPTDKQTPMAAPMPQVKPPAAACSAPSAH